MKKYNFRMGVLVDKLLLDRALINSIVKGVWVSFANIITIILIANYYSPDNIGYYYTFLSLINAQTFVEMGLLLAISQTVSHEICKIDEGEQVAALALSRLNALLKFAIKWFFFGGIIFSIVMILFGAHLFERVGESLYHNDHFLIWIWFVLFNALLLLVIPFQAFVEGSNNISDIALMKLFQSIISSAIFWCGVSLNGGFYFVLVIPLISFFIAVIWIFKRHLIFFKRILRAKIINSSFSWRSDIFPFQWRLSISWIAGFFVFNLYTPLLFKYSGAEGAGQFGMTLQLLTIISSASILWVSTKFSQFGIFVSKGMFSELNSLFYRQFKFSIYVLISLVFVFLIANFFARLIWPSIESKILSGISLFSMILAVVANHITFGISYYLRSFRREPLMIVSVMNSIFTIILGFLFIPIYSVNGAAISYALSNLFVGLIGTLIVFKRLCVKI